MITVDQAEWNLAPAQVPRGTPWNGHTTTYYLQLNSGTRDSSSAHDPLVWCTGIIWTRLLETNIQFSQLLFV